jgi:hypothetical protein
MGVRALHYAHIRIIFQVFKRTYQLFSNYLVVLNSTVVVCSAFCLFVLVRGRSDVEMGLLHDSVEAGVEWKQTRVECSCLG